MIAAARCRLTGNGTAQLPSAKISDVPNTGPEDLNRGTTIQ
jgi:hypothetical protein